MFKLYILLKDVFKAGAQSKQAEIDELRKRIDEVIERSNHAHIGYQMLYKQFNDVINILKGITND